MADFIAHWTFTYNVPMVLNNFFYLMMILITIVGVTTGLLAARAFKKAEKYMPVDANYEDKQSKRDAKKSHSKG